MKYFTLYLLFFILLFSACGAKYITMIDQVLPPRAPFPQEVRAVTMLDRARERNLGSRIESGDVLGQSNVSLLRTTASRLPIQAEVHNKGLRDASAGAPAPRMSRTEVQTYVGRAQALLSLEQLAFQEERRMLEFDKHQLDERGDDYYIRAVKATEESRLQALWRLYDGRSGALLEEWPYALNDNFEVEALDYASANAKLDSLHHVNPDAMAREMIDRFVADVSPTPVESNWLYYTKGNQLVERSAAYMEEQRYELAARYLEENERIIPQLKKPARAHYNWATACFLAGDQVRAASLAREGYNRYGKSEFSSLLQKIGAY